MSPILFAMLSIFIAFNASAIEGDPSSSSEKKRPPSYAWEGRCHSWAKAPSEQCIHKLDTLKWHLISDTGITQSFDGWNYPDYPMRLFESEIVSVDLANSEARSRKYFRVEMYAKLEKPVYEYYADLDADGQILAARWVPSPKPDFVWMPKSVNCEAYKDLKEIYNSSKTND